MADGIEFQRRFLRIAVHDYCGHPFQFELSRELARRGHEVRHFFFADDIGPKGHTQGSPNDPDNFSVDAVSLEQAYRKRNLFRRRQADILYGKLVSQKIVSFAPDVTISGNAPLDAQATLRAEAHNAGSAFVFWMQDFLSLAAEKILCRKFPIIGHGIGAYYRRLEGRILRESDGVVLISDDFKPALSSLGVRGEIIDVVPNWGALGELPVRPKNNAWAKAHGFSDKFVFLYSGTLGLKHDPNKLWALAERFKNDRDVIVAVAGSGLSYDTLKARAALHPMANLVLLPLQPMEAFADVLGSADAFIALLEEDAGPFCVPSKILNYLCAGRATLLSAPLDNLAVRVIEKAAAGICVSAKDTDSFVEAAVRLRNDPEACVRFGRAGRDYAERTFDITAIADRFEEIFAQSIRRHRAGKDAIAGTRAATRVAAGKQALANSR